MVEELLHGVREPQQASTGWILKMFSWQVLDQEGPSQRGVAPGGVLEVHHPPRHSSSFSSTTSDPSPGPKADSPPREL